MEGDGPPASLPAFIIIPPNQPVYHDLAVLDRLEAYLADLFPLFDVEVARVVQLRIESFTLLERGEDDEGKLAEGSLATAIRDALDRFDPHSA
jgi:hypothetical protein